MGFFMDVKHMGGVKITPLLKIRKTSAIYMKLGRNVVQHVNIWNKAKKVKKVLPFCWRQHFFGKILAKFPEIFIFFHQQ